MSGKQDIIRLPYRITDFNEDIVPLLNRNFAEIERMLSQLQMYEKKIGKPVNETVDSITDNNGKVISGKLDDKMVGLEHALQIAEQAVTTSKIALNAVTEALLADGAVTNLKLAAGAVTEAKTNWQTHLLSDYGIANNTPMIGFISWSGVKIVYKGEEYEVMDGSTDKLYIWWDFDYPTIMQTAQILPTMTDDDALVFLNKNGVHLVVPKATVVDGSLLVSESVLTDALAANAVTALKIAAGAVEAIHLAAKSVTAEKINVDNLAAISANLGTVNAGFINVGDKVIDVTDVATSHDGQIQNDSNVTAYFPFDDSLYDSKNIIPCVFNRDSVAYLPNGTQVGTDIARYDTARIIRGVLIEEGTTNLLTANQSSIETDLTGFNTSAGWMKNSGATISRDTLEHLFGSASLKVATPGIQVSEGVETDLITLLANTSYTISSYVKIPAGITLRFCIRDHTNNIFPLDIIVGNGKWQRISLTLTTGANAPSVSFGIVTHGIFATNFYLDGLQLEQKPYPTSWTLGGTTRQPETLTVPTTGVFQKGNWTVEMTYIPKSVVNDGIRRVLWRVFIDANNYYSIVKETTGEIFGIVKSNGVSYSIYDSIFLVKDTPTHIMFCGDGTNIALYKDGLRVGNPINYIESLGDLPAIQTIGVSQTFQSHCNGIIDELRFSKVARTLVEHQAYYNSNKGFTDIDPIIRAGLMVNGFMVTPEGGAKCYHSNGSFSQMSWDGFRRYVAGEGKDYHYLTEIARVSTVGSASHSTSPWWDESVVLTYIPPVTIQLSNDFKGKQFKVFAEPRMSDANMDWIFSHFTFSGSGTVYWQMRRVICEVINIDYINATFKIKAYAQARLGTTASTTESERITGIDVTYTVTA